MCMDIYTHHAGFSFYYTVNPCISNVGLYRYVLAYTDNRNSVISLYVNKQMFSDNWHWCLGCIQFLCQLSTAFLFSLIFFDFELNPYEVWKCWLFLTWAFPSLPHLNQNLQVVPRCPRCPADEPLAIMKPEIVFFGENLPEQFHRAMKYDKDEVDLLIVIGSSLKVRPVALIPSKSVMIFRKYFHIYRHGLWVCTIKSTPVILPSET